MTRTPFDLATVDRLLSTTRSVRRRLDLDRPVDRMVVRRCVELAAHAPNASNAQAWRWLLIDDPDRKRLVADLYRAGIEPPMQALLERRREAGDDAGVRHSRAVLELAARLHDVPILVVPCFPGPTGTEPEREADTTSRYASILPAVWAFQLALHSRGLGSTLTTAHLLHAAEVATILGIPAGWRQAGLVPVAHLTGPDLAPPSRRPVDEIIAFNHWNGS